MENILALIIGVLKIALLDLTLSGDNIGIIALSTKNLPKVYAKRARFVGIGLAVGLRIIFVCFLTMIISIKWLPIKLVGGIILAKITWDFIKPQEEEAINVKVADKFLEAIFIIVIADLSMSLDNVLAIAGAANGNITLVIFGIAINIPILIYGSQFVSDLMTKYKIAIYIGGAVLAHTSVMMILEDPLLNKYVPHMFTLVFPWIIAISVLLYGFKIVKKENLKRKMILEEVSMTVSEDKINEGKDNNDADLHS